MAKRNAISDLNHDNWADEEEPEEAGTFRQADKNTLQGRVIKKAVRRGIKQADGPNLFSGFGGFKSTSDSSTTSSFGSSGGSLGSTGAFDFLAKKTNGSSSTNTDSPAKGAAFNFASPGTSETGFAFGTPGSKSDSVNSSLGNGNGSTEEKPASAGLFAFGSANAKSSFGSFGSTTTTNSEEKSNVSLGKADGENDKKETPAAPLKPLTEFFKPKESDIKSDQDAPKKEKNWSCPVCMVSNAPDKEECPCCTEPKPGSKPKPKAAAVVPSLGGSITGAGFKFGATTTDTSSSSNSSGFKFGTGTGNAESLMKPPASTIVPNTGFKFGNSSETNSKNEENTKTSPKKDMEYSREFLSHLKQLNKQVTAWLKTHVDKNPYVFLSPVFKDYERHLKDLEKKFKPLESQQKPLLGAVFGSSETNKNTEPVKFGTSSGFAFGSTGSTDQAVSTNTKTTSGLAFGSSSSTSKKEEEEKSVKTTLISQPSSGFGITSENSESIPAKSGIEKPSTGFSFAGGATDNKPSSQPSFSFGSSGSTESKPTPGFSFGKTTTTDKTDAPAPTGFSFGATTATTTENSETKTTSGFSFGSTTKSDDKPSTGGFTFGSFGSSDTKPTGFSGFGTSTFGAPATSATPEASKTDEADDEDQPPKVEVKEVLEDDAYFSVRCKLFYKKGKEFTEKGLGMLHLKKVDGGKTQLLVRAETNLGNILLNILVNDQMNIDKRKNNIQFGCIPNPPIPGLPEGPVIMLVKVKDVLMADQLEEKLKEATNPST